MTDEWVARIGAEAAALRNRSVRILFGAIALFLVYLLASLIAGGVVRSDGDARNLVALSDLIIALPLFAVGFVWSRRVQARACRVGAAFIGLERVTGERSLPAVALRNPTMFDNLMIRRNVSSGGRYKPHPSASWIANTDGRFGEGKF